MKPNGTEQTTLLEIRDSLRDIYELLVQVTCEPDPEDELVEEADALNKSTIVES